MALIWYFDTFRIRLRITVDDRPALPGGTCGALDVGSERFF